MPQAYTMTFWPALTGSGMGPRAMPAEPAPARPAATWYVPRPSLAWAWFGLVSPEIATLPFTNTSTAGATARWRTVTRPVLSVAFEAYLVTGALLFTKTLSTGPTTGGAERLAVTV